MRLFPCSLKLLVYLNDHSGRYQKSILYLEDIINILSGRNQKEDRISLMNYKGWLNMRREEYSAAIEIFQKGISYAEENGEMDDVLKFYYNLAKAYERIGLEDQEVHYYNKYLDNVDWEINVDEEIDTLLYKMPTMLIQPFVENSIGHGLMHKEGKGHVSVDLKLDDEVILCTIEDNGIGRDRARAIKKQKEESHNSLGTTITESRIRLVNSLYGQNMKVIYTDLKDENGNPLGTRVQISVPVMG